MKLLLASALAFVALAIPVRAASDTDVTIIKVEKVVIEENAVTIVAEAKTSIITLEVVIRKNLIISIDGPGFLYAKGQ